MSDNSKNIKAEQKKRQLALLWVTSLSHLQIVLSGPENLGRAEYELKSTGRDIEETASASSSMSRREPTDLLLQSHFDSGTLTKEPIIQATYILEIKTNICNCT